MTLFVFLAVLAAAFLHAAWNALIKRGASKLGDMVLLAAVSVPIGAVVTDVLAALLADGVAETLRREAAGPA